MSLSNENWRKMPPEEFAKWAVGKTFRLYDDYATTYLVQGVELPLGTTRGISTTCNDPWRIETLQQVAELVEEPNELTKLREQNRILKEALEWSLDRIQWLIAVEDTKVWSRDGIREVTSLVDEIVAALEKAKEKDGTNKRTN